ncbi:MAG: heme A synthase [Microthrixaceae bacterium]|nr:heme A synthase [Microthrixaceae bacterium]
MALPRCSPRTYQKITLLALVLLSVIVVTGGAVRLTGSGLGCSDWPTCEENRLVAPLEYHAMVEFVNRTFTGLLSAAVILAVLGSLVRAPRRRDLTWWSLGLVAGMIGQIVLGGLTVLFELSPPFVMGHFLLSMVIIWNAVVLHHLAGQPPTAARPLVSDDVRWMGRLMVAAAGLAIFLGTVVTGSGPHGGDPEVERLDLVVGEVVRFHGGSVVLFGLVTLATLWMLRRRGELTRDILRRGEILLVVLVAQAAVGYTQYFTGVPIGLVALHLVGSVLVWIAVLTFELGLHEHPAPAAAGAGPADDAARPEATAVPAGG